MRRAKEEEERPRASGKKHISNIHTYFWNKQEQAFALCGSAELEKCLI
jgi:hypothetical protein